mmetsp:Transcript_2861/g.8729  ORF Transcript_2861/g.8729 Transcript_2861/m.8729 type:complete len:304 (+) Transcript_2861:73-984(+)
MVAFDTIWKLCLIAWDVISQRFIFWWKPRPLEEAVKRRSLAGKVAVVTGGNSGLGKETAKVLAAAGAKVIITCRSKQKGEATVRELRPFISGVVDYEVADLSSLESVRSCAKRLLATGQAIDYLILNAGVMCLPLEASVDGIPEMHFATNHIGHFLLTVLLLPLLKRSSSARVVAVSSLTCVFDQLDLSDIDFKRRGYASLAAYAASKECNMLFVLELSRRLQHWSNFSAFGVHPGDIGTSISQRMYKILQLLHHYLVSPLLLLSLEAGTRTILYAATSPTLKGRRELCPFTPPASRTLLTKC